jgi:CMP/dCMP kinase
VVFPDAAAKFFLTADPSVRARRRFEEMSAAGQAADLAATRDDLERRDARDTTRAAAPLLEAPDAVRVDSTDLELEEVVERMLAAVRAREAGIG